MISCFCWLRSVHWCISRDSFGVEILWDRSGGSTGGGSGYAYVGCGLVGSLIFQLAAVFLCTNLLETENYIIFTKFYRRVIPQFTIIKFTEWTRHEQFLYIKLHI
jgi:hypothetical protein